MAAHAVPPADHDPAQTQASRPDNLPNPLAEQQAQLRQEAITQLVQGEAVVKKVKGNRVIELAAKGPGKKGKYVNYPLEREEEIFTILAEFGNAIHPATGGTPGPARNQIPMPDRDWDGDATDDNSTFWTADFDQEHYLDLMFGDGESLQDFYLKQSNGRFLATGDVSDWVKLSYNEARYGSNSFAESSTYWPFIRDTAQAWYDAQVAAGLTQAEITDYLTQFDTVDRYDYDGDGDFNEPDGYIDHFQAIHAGMGEEAGGGAQGTDAIWSHRWYAYYTSAGTTGPGFNKMGGVPLGDSGIWIGDYTTEPENGGLGVFAHEFGHDLGLPDLYDTAGGDNGTGFWSLMSAGSWLNRGGDSIGTSSSYMGAWEKLQLGWLDFTTVPYGQSTKVKLSPADLSSRGGGSTQAVLVTLPDKLRTTDYNTPHAGLMEWWSGDADASTTTLTRLVDLTGKTSASLSAMVQADIEAGYDYLYVQASTDQGESWADLEAITGPGDGTLSPWAEKSWDLDAYAGSPVTLRFAYVTDEAVRGKGAFLDDISLTVDGVVVSADGAEEGDEWWSADGFRRIDGTTSELVTHYYLAENRVYSGYDKALQTGPYNFGFSSSRPDWVERFPYQNGLLVSYVDTGYTDNNTSAHPGGGLVLPVDARPAPIVFPDGSLLSNRRQVFDATFGLEATDAVTFHRNGSPVSVPSQPAVAVFDDSDPNRYWSQANPESSVKVAGSGTKLTVFAAPKRGQELQVRITFDQR
ncbi:immune inhibitor A domain-containing protein [Ornithinimicrobium cryptoxanthini]|uniref:immune inhibitor A domain-containing protein n=1 Tax=Ornithinimicrobium cryptoxanthini TaxID=2934161 RepID=UPI0021180181|nr:immune inhibitor A domain-containing protein [Ornithinimicrobium cryptoxanthini]